MIAVGIDVSKSKSTVAILNGDGSIRAKPFDVHHVSDELQTLVNYIKGTSESPTILTFLCRSFTSSYRRYLCVFRYLERIGKL